jgi:hypothetical protein
MARPIPEVEPVTTAVLPFSDMVALDDLDAIAAAKHAALRGDGHKGVT